MHLLWLTSDISKDGAEPAPFSTQPLIHGSVGRYHATIGHCVICGIVSKRQLCIPCRKQYSDPATGELHPAVRALQAEQDKEYQRDKRNRDRLARGPKRNAKGHGGAR